jgi:hypothetical protein
MKTMMAQIQNGAIPNCSTPWYDDILGKEGHKVPTCDADQDILLNSEADDVMFKLNTYEHMDCLKPCKIISHKVKFSKTSLHNGGTVNPRRTMLMYYTEKTVVLKSQTKLVTFNGFVSSVGGSLGLFLGFSCMATLFGLVECIRNKL